MDLSYIPRNTALGAVLRAPLRLIPRGMAVPVLQGHLRGMTWVVGSSEHGCWLGTYEARKQQMFARYVPVGGVVYDLGANVGFYTLLSSRLVADAGRVVAFEPCPKNVAALNRHLALNAVRNVTVFAAAVGDHDGVATFREGPTHTMGKIDPTGDREVRLLALDTLVARGEVPPPDLIKIDVEGAELDVLKGARGVVERHRPVIFLATHNEAVHDGCCRWLTSAGYRLESLSGRPVEETDELLARWDPASSASSPAA